jgi:hypothetical protein
MDIGLPAGPSLAKGIALVLASGVALAWAVRRETLPRAVLRWVAPPVVAIGCIALWRDWPRGWAITTCLLALPLLIAAQVLVAAITGRAFRDRTDEDDDQAAIELADGYLGLSHDTAMPARDPVGHFLFDLALYLLGFLVLCGAVLARLLWRLAPRGAGGLVRVATATICSTLLLAGSAMLAVAGVRPPVAVNAVQRASPDIEQAWVETRAGLVAQAPRVSWLHLRTPLLPLAWPPAQDTAWVRYHYAGGGEPGLLDAVWVAYPFAREVVARDGHTLRSERLPGLRTERQGVRPLTGALAGPTSADADRAALALDGPPAPEAAGTGVMREVHGHYWSANSVLRQGVEPAHRAFFAWLDQAP